MPDDPNATRPPTRPPRTRGLLFAIGGIVVVLCAIFAVTTLRQRAAFETYKGETLGDGQRPWDGAAFSVPACVEFAVQWAMQCPGVESWCFNEAPQLVRACLESSDRSAYCQEVGDAVSSTSFGYAQCDALRQNVEGRYAKRNHKKHCAAAHRAIAEHCRREHGAPADAPAS